MTNGLEAKLAKHETERSELVVKVKSLEDSLSKEKKQSEAALKQYELATKQLSDKFASEKSQSEKDNARYESQLEAAKLSFESSKSTWQQQHKDLTKRVGELEKQLATAQSEVERSNARATRIEQEQASTRQNSDLELFNMKKTITQRSEEAKMWKEKAAEHKMELEARAKEINDQAEKIEQAKEERDEIQAELKTAQVRETVN